MVQEATDNQTGVSDFTDATAAEEPAPVDQVQVFPVEVVEISKLKPHPRNYQKHPPDEIAHIKASIEENGVYRNVVVADDYTLIAGHGVIQAMTELGLTHAPVHRLNLAPEDPRAIKVLLGDNTIAHLAEPDDRLLADLLRQVKEEVSTGLLGTGYDDMMLASLLFVTRAEVKDVDTAAHWVGMPEYELPPPGCEMSIRFDSEEGRAEFIKQVGLEPHRKLKSVYAWWPARKPSDPNSLEWQESPSEETESGPEKRE